MSTKDTEKNRLSTWVDHSGETMDWINEITNLFNRTPVEPAKILITFTLSDLYL